MFDHLRDRWFGTDDKAPPMAEDPLVKWNAEHINKNASTIREALFGCSHIVEVRWIHIFKADYEHASSSRNRLWRLNNEFLEQYTYPFRNLGDHSVVIEMRGIYTNDNDIFERNEFGGDGVFVGTNNEADAMMIALKYK